MCSFTGFWICESVEFFASRLSQQVVMATLLSICDANEPGMPWKASRSLSLTQTAFQHSGKTKSVDFLTHLPILWQGNSTQPGLTFGGLGAAPLICLMTECSNTAERNMPSKSALTSRACYLAKECIPGKKSNVGVMPDSFSTPSPLGIDDVMHARDRFHYLEAGCGLDRPSGPGSSCLAKHTSSPGFCTSTSSTAFRGAGGGGAGCAAATGAMGGCTMPLLEMAGIPAQQFAYVRPNINATQRDHVPGRQNLHTASSLTPR